MFLFNLYNNNDYLYFSYKNIAHVIFNTNYNTPTIMNCRKGNITSHFSTVAVGFEVISNYVDL